MDVVELTKKLIRIESITGSEGEIAGYIASQLKSDDVEFQEVKGFGPNIIAKGEFKRDRPTIILNCHMDTVEVMQGWKGDPFKPRVQGDRLYGLGACDMKAGCAIAMDIFNSADHFDVNLIFTAVVDEEGISSGSYWLLKKLKKEKLLRNKSNMLCLIPEDTQETIKMGARGRYVIEITLTGCSAHGATPECGTNAITEGAKVINALPNLPMKNHPRMGMGSLCVLKVQGGGDSLSVPDTCKIFVDRHTVPSESKERILGDFGDLVKNLTIPCDIQVALLKRDTPYLEPYVLDSTNQWARRIFSSYRDFYKKEPQTSYGKSVGDFNAFGKEMPTIVFGPMGENIHAPNEYVLMSSITRCRDFYLRFLDSLRRT